MTGEPRTPASTPQRWARLRSEYHRDYPASYQELWFRVVERHDPDLPAAHFEIAERTKRRILLVDDEPGIRQTLQIALSNQGYEVLQARDGEEATRLWHEAGPDLVIADIHMPKKSGLLLIQDLQAHSSSTRVIVITDGGRARQFNLLGLAELLGAARTIAKPFTLDEMMDAVHQELSR